MVSNTENAELHGSHNRYEEPSSSRGCDKTLKQLKKKKNQEFTLLLKYLLYNSVKHKRQNVTQQNIPLEVDIKLTAMFLIFGTVRSIKDHAGNVHLVND